jgi:hypothetical protein
MSEPFKRGEILTAAKLNAAIGNSRRLTVAGDGASSVDADGDVIRVDGYSNIYIRLTSKTGTNPIKYAWTEVFRNANGTWSNTTNNGTTTGDYAIELNNSNLSTSDNYVYRAERSPESGEWLFFLRRSQTVTGQLNFRFTGTANTSVSPDIFSFSKQWGRTNNVTKGTGCPSSNVTNSQNSTYNNITFYYTPNGGSRTDLVTYENNGTANSPINVWQSSNVTFPGTIGVECVYYDGNVWGSYTNANSCGNSYSQAISANTQANQSVSNGTANVSLGIDFNPALIYPADSLSYPSSVTLNFTVSYADANPLWPAGVQTAYNDWSANVASQLANLSIGVNTVTKSCSGYTLTYGRKTGTPTHEFDITSNTCGSTKIKLWAFSNTELGTAAPYYFAGSDRVNLAGVNTELKYSFGENGGGTGWVASNVTNANTPTGSQNVDFANTDDCTLITNWNPTSANITILHSMNVNFGYDDSGNCTAYQQTFSYLSMGRS